MLSKPQRTRLPRHTYGCNSGGKFICTQQQKELQHKKGGNEIYKLLCTADSCQLADSNGE